MSNWLEKSHHFATFVIEPRKLSCLVRNLNHSFVFSDFNLLLIPSKILRCHHVVSRNNVNFANKDGQYCLNTMRSLLNVMFIKMINTLKNYLPFFPMMKCFFPPKKKIHINSIFLAHESGSFEFLQKSRKTSDIVWILFHPTGSQFQEIWCEASTFLGVNFPLCIRLHQPSTSWMVSWKISWSMGATRQSKFAR